MQIKLNKKKTVGKIPIKNNWTILTYIVELPAETCHTLLIDEMPVVT